MAKSKSDRRKSGCPIAFTLDALGDKWSLLIVRDMVFKGRRRYGEFLEGKEGIATNILADRLRRLEADGIVARTPDPEAAGRFRYDLTERGVALVPVVLEIILWGARHDAGTAAPDPLLARLESDRASYAAEVLQAIREDRAAPYYAEALKPGR